MNQIINISKSLNINSSVTKYDCINLHFIDTCNFSCKHCFVKKEDRNELSFDQLKSIVDKIDIYFKENNIKGRINLAGGEPLLSKNIDNLISYIANKGIMVSLITNGYRLIEEFINKHKTEIDMIGISVDSLQHNINLEIGRCCKDETIDEERLILLSDYIKSVGIRLKINICVSKLNVNENFNDFLNTVKPDRCKILQMSCTESDKENFDNILSTTEFNKFVEKLEYKHVTESKEDIENSYLIIDSLGKLSTNNLHEYGVSIFDHTLEEAISKINIDYFKFVKRNRG